MRSDVLAIVVNYKGCEDTAQAVRSLLDDAVVPQVVVVDNSTDADEATRLRSALPPAVQLLVAEQNLGFGRACNLALQQADPAWVWLVNPDARARPGCLAALCQALEQDPALAAVAPQQYLDADEQWLFAPAWLPTAIDRWARQRVRIDQRHRERFDRAVRAETLRLWQVRDAALPLRQRALSGSNLLLRADALDPRFGIFDPAFFMYFEDSDLCMRLRRQGHGLAVVPGARALHHWHLGAYKEELMAQSAPLYDALHFGASAWLNRADTQGRSPLDLEQGWPTWPVGEPWLVPPAWLAGWSIEISPLELFSPSIGRVGQGAAVAWPAPVAAAMPGVPLYARLGPLSGSSTPLLRRIV